MNQQETDLLNFENELLNTRKKLNDLICQCTNEHPDSDEKALYQEKIFYLETELTYLNRQFQLLKQRQYNAFHPQGATVQAPNMPPPGFTEADVRRQPIAQPAYSQPQNTHPQADRQPLPPQPDRQPIKVRAYQQASKWAEHKVNILAQGNQDSGILETDVPEDGNPLTGLITTYQELWYCQAHSRLRCVSRLYNATIFDTILQANQ